MTQTNSLTGKDIDLVKPSASSLGLTILGLINELEDQGKKSSDRFLTLARRNELHVNGDQFRDVDNRSNTIEDIPWNSEIPQVFHNLLRNLVLTWCSRLLQDRPAVTAYPSSAEQRDIDAAETAKSIIEFIEAENNIDQKMFDILRLACSHGMGGIKAVFDPDKNEVRWDVVTVFDFYIDQEEDPDNAKWVLFHRYVDVHEAKAMLKKIGMEDDVQEEEYSINDLDTRTGVKVYELWYRPDSRVKKGVYALAVSGNVVEHMDYPYTFPYLEDPESKMTRSILPLSLFRVGQIRGTVYGDTWMNDAVPIQRQINEIESVLVKLRRDTGSVRLLAPGGVAEAWESGNHIMKIDDPAKAQMIRWLDPPKINEILFRDRDRLEQRLYDIAGLNEVLTGAESAKSGTSAKQIAYLSQLDNMKHAGTARHIEKFLIILWQNTLHLVRSFYDHPRIVRIVGEDKSISSITFIGADIQGIDVRLEPRTGMERYHAQKAKDIVERAQMGLEDPNTLPERSLTGLDMTSDQASMVSMVNGQIQAALSGIPQQPLPNVDPAMAADIIMDAISSLGVMGEIDITPLWGLSDMYSQIAQQQAMMAQQQQAMMPQGEPQ